MPTKDQSLPTVRIQQDVVTLKRFACNTCRLSVSRVVWQLPFFLRGVGWLCLLVRSFRVWFFFSSCLFYLVCLFILILILCVW